MVQFRVLEQGTSPWQQPVIDKDLSTNPGSESKGDRYIVAATATGQWVGQENNIATAKVASPASAGDWYFDTPAAGHRVWVNDEATGYYFDGSTWDAQPDINDLDDVPDGSTYGRVLNTDLSANHVNKLDDNAGSSITAAQAKDAYDRRGQYDTDLKVILFEL